MAAARALAVLASPACLAAMMALSSADEAAAAACATHVTVRTMLNFDALPDSALFECSILWTVYCHGVSVEMKQIMHSAPKGQCNGRQKSFSQSVF